MQTKTLIPMLVATIGYYATKFKESWDMATQEVQKVIDLYTATGLPAMNSDELHLLFNDTENMLYTKLTGGEQAHLTIGKGADRGHLAVNKRAAMDMITKPTGYNELLEGIKQCNKVCLAGFSPHSPWDVRFPASAIKDNFVVDAEGNLQLTVKVQNDLAEAGKVYAKTEKGQALYTFLKKVSDAFIESGLDKFYYAHLSTMSGDKLAQIIQEGVKEINLETKTFVPVIISSHNIFPKLYFDNDLPNL